MIIPFIPIVIGIWLIITLRDIGHTLSALQRAVEAIEKGLRNRS